MNLSRKIHFSMICALALRNSFVFNGRSPRPPQKSALNALPEGNTLHAPPCRIRESMTLRECAKMAAKCTQTIPSK